MAIKVFLACHIAANGLINDTLANSTYAPELAVPCGIVSVWLLSSAIAAVRTRPYRDEIGALGLIFYMGWAMNQVIRNMDHPKIVLIYIGLSLLSFTCALVAGVKRVGPKTA